MQFFRMSLTDPDNHQRTIIHIDIDCFYAQVEMVTDPTLVDRPLGIQRRASVQEGQQWGVQYPG